MNSIITENFLLSTDYAERLYHNYASKVPVIDYHNHLPPQEMAEDKKFSTITEIWLKGDHYKHRAMRALGVNEKFITGNSTDEEKFNAWAACVPKTIRNPLFHWTHMELKTPFGINRYLNSETGKDIYTRCNSMLREDSFSVKSLLTRFNVEMACTTDDPCSDLSAHKTIRAAKGFTKVLPGFRPDKVFNIENKNTFLEYISLLSDASGVKIHNITTLLEALQNRVEYFHAQGCVTADHGLTTVPQNFDFSIHLENEFERYLENKSTVSFSDPDRYRGYILSSVCKMYHKKQWIQQFHIGAIRNNNTRFYTALGADAGFDSIGDFKHAEKLNAFLNELDKTNELAKTVIYNSNPADNEVFATVAGNFNDGTVQGKVQYGPGWWFLDQLDGMEKQLNTLSNLGLISTFIGMVTDSRSFLSFPRHEYFRRLLCNILGNEMNKGMLPNDEAWIGKIVQDICYNNAKEYFNIPS